MLQAHEAILCHENILEQVTQLSQVPPNFIAIRRNIIIALERNCYWLNIIVIGSNAIYIWFKRNVFGFNEISSLFNQIIYSFI